MLLGVLFLPVTLGMAVSGSCLEKCFGDAEALSVAGSVDAFRFIAEDIEHFCRVNEGVLRCGRECPSEEIPELERRTELSSFICSQKVEEFRLARECLIGEEDHGQICRNKCGATDGKVVVNEPETCTGIMCTVACSKSAFGKACAGTGELYQDVIRQIVKMNNESIETIPEECAPLANSSLFDDHLKLDGMEEDTLTTSAAEEMPKEPTNAPLSKVNDSASDISEKVEETPIIDNTATVSSESEASGEEDTETTEEPTAATEPQLTTETVIVIDNGKEHLTSRSDVSVNEPVKYANGFLSYSSLAVLMLIAHLVL